MTKPRGRPFQVGNTAGRGRPKGSRNRATLIRQELFGEYADAVTRKCLAMALKGDGVAMRLCIERIHPLRRAMPVEFDMPPIEKLSDLPAAVNSVLHAVSMGQLTPAEGQQIVPLLESLGGVLTVKEFETRLRSIEEAIAAQQDSKKS